MPEAVLSLEDAEPRRISEHWLAVLIGLGVFALALLSYAAADALGWVATTSVWTDPGAQCTLKSRRLRSGRPCGKSSIRRQVSLAATPDLD